jgi:serine/threonine protein kinase/beta-lactam-binding protein with PASTA domain
MTAPRDRTGALTGRLVDGRFRLGALIGHGAMAEVYAATDEHLGRDVAVKVLRPQYAGDDDYVGRFNREARIAAKLSHPNLVNVYDTGDNVDAGDQEPRSNVARPYIVLERLPGHTLADRLQHRRLPLDEAIDIAKQVADGVGFAHRKHLVHRDLKPANILLTDEGDAKVADFGLAQDLRDPSATLAGTVWGTVQYLAPERAEGDPASIASDIYALGTVVYEMLTGTPPFTGGTAASIMQRQVNEAPKPLGEVVPAYRGDVEHVVMRALAKSPRERYESMEAFSAALGRLTRTPSDDTSPGSTTVTERHYGPTTRALPAQAMPGTPRRADTGTRLPGAASRMPAPPRPNRPSGVDRDTPGGHTTRTRAVIVGSILSVFALMGLGAWLVRTLALGGPLDAPLPMATVAAAPSAVPGIVTLTAMPATPSPATVLVPVVTGDTATRARDTLTAVGLVAETSEAWNRDVPAGLVAAQDPGAGTSVARGQVVRVTVSKGVQRVVVPNTIGKTGPNARDELTRAGLRVELVEENTPLTVAGVVFEQQPRGGEVDPAEPVVIKVSRGPARPMVPGVIGMKADDARRILEQEGFRVAIRAEANSAVDPDVAFAQFPLGGASAERGSTVDVRVRRDAHTPATGVPGTVTATVTTLPASGTAGTPVRTPLSVPPATPAISTTSGPGTPLPRTTVASGVIPSVTPRIQAPSGLPPATPTITILPSPTSTGRSS